MLDFIPEHEIGNKSQTDKKEAQDNTVEIELGIIEEHCIFTHVHRLQYLFAAGEDASWLVTVQ